MFPVSVAALKISFMVEQDEWNYFRYSQIPLITFDLSSTILRLGEGPYAPLS